MNVVEPKGNAKLLKDKESVSPKARRPRRQKPVAAVAESDQADNVEQHGVAVAQDTSDDGHASSTQLTIQLTKSLLNRIKYQAQEEGVSEQDLIQEFLAESVTLRAWEIIERKGQMQLGGQSQGNNRQQSHNRNNNNYNNNRKGRGGMSHSRYQAIMDDKANFLEYVRNQEKNRR